MRHLLSACLLSILCSVLSPAVPQPSGKFMGQRYLTLNTVVRVNLDGWTCDFLAARREGFREGIQE